MKARKLNATTNGSDTDRDGGSEPSPFPLMRYRNQISRSLVSNFARTAAMTAALTSVVACSQSPSTSVISSEAADQNRIIGGSDVTGTEVFAKHVVGLYDLSMGALCTASILSDSIAVTAAHCVASPASNLRVVFGNDFNSQSLIVRPVDSYKVSPLWAFRQGQEFNNGDIAVLRFSGGLPAGYSPIKFLSDTSLLKDGGKVTLGGYGASSVVQVKDPTTGEMGSDHQNAGKLRYVDTTIKQAAYTKSEVLIEQSRGKGACHGDSGGPAYIEVNGEPVLFGVTSRGVDDPNDTCGVSSAYTSVAYYGNWIKRTAKELNDAATSPRPVVAGVASGVAAPRPGT